MFNLSEPEKDATPTHYENSSSIFSTKTSVYLISALLSPVVASKKLLLVVVESSSFTVLTPGSTHVCVIGLNPEDR